MLEELLAVAARAPSGTNIQPWKVWVLTGKSKARLSERILAAFDDPEEAATHSESYPYYPRKWVSPYIERRRKVGLDLYQLLGIQKGDAERMHKQHARNFTFFDAPVGLIFTVDAIMEQGSWLDYGMFVQNIMLAAKARGLDTCSQAAFIQFHRILKEELGFPDSETVVVGMALGYGNPDAPENALRTERAPLEEWVPACNPTGNLEFPVGGGRAKYEGEAATNDYVFQAKTLFRPLEINDWGWGLAVGTIRHPEIDSGPNMLGNTYAYIPL